MSQGVSLEEKAWPAFNLIALLSAGVQGERSQLPAAAPMPVV